MSSPAALPLVSPTALAPATPGASGNGAGMDRAKIRQVARQFEAIFVRQMLAEARKSSLDTGEDGGLFEGKDQTFREMQDSRFADIAAAKGTFGLAKMIEKQLMARSAASLPTPTTGAGG